MSLVDRMRQNAKNAAEGDLPEFWNPEPGDSVEGEVVRVSSTPSKHGDYHIYIVTVKTDNGETVAVSARHKSLREEVESANLQKGDKVGVIYNGKRKSTKSSYSYESYEFDYERANPNGEKPV